MNRVGPTPLGIDFGHRRRILYPTMGSKIFFESASAENSEKNIKPVTLVLRCVAGGLTIAARDKRLTSRSWKPSIRFEPDLFGKHLFLWR